MPTSENGKVGQPMAHQVNENQSWASQHNPKVPHPDFLLKVIRHNGRICLVVEKF